jgi:hypothetical protein
VGKKAKKAKKERSTPEEGVAKAKAPKRSRRFAVVEEDEDFAELLEEYGDTYEASEEETS